MSIADFAPELDRLVKVGQVLDAARRTVESFDRDQAMRDIERRRLAEPLPVVMEESSAKTEFADPGSSDRALDEAIMCRIGQAIAAVRAEFNASLAAALEEQQEFLLQVVGDVLGETNAELSKRIDAHAHDILQVRGLIHEGSLAIRGLMGNAPTRTMRVRVQGRQPRDHRSAAEPNLAEFRRRR
jgi:hypothetical protein